MELLVGDKVGCLDIQLAVSLGSHFTDHALDVVYAILFNSSAVELIEELTGSTDIYIEYIYIGIGIFLPYEHRMLCSVHAADLGAVFLAALPALRRT